MTAAQLIDITAELWGAAFCLMAAISSLVGGKPDKPTQKLVYLEINNVFLLLADVFAWIFRGNATTAGYYIVRISNFLVFVLSYIMIITVSQYVFCYTDENRTFQKIWKRAMWLVTAAAIVLMAISQFNHMFYYFDEENYYHRGTYFVYSQISAILGSIAIVILLIQNRKYLQRSQYMAFWGYIILPITAIIIQLFVYGIALFNLSITISIMFMFFMSQTEKGKKMVEQERALNDMQLKIVFSQIQPHFLYNSLNAIYYLCGKDAGAAQEAISEFSDYLRGNLDALKKNTPIPFETELHHVENYLKLEKMRFEEELAIVYDIQATDFKLPALSLQPLVENAVKHGVGKAANGGTVTISSCETEKEYILSVKDDGVGYDRNEKKNDGRSHIGISNVQQRLKSMCGGTLEIQSEIGKGTISTIHIPK